LNLPNFLTLTRIALVPVFFSLLLQPPAENTQSLFFALFIFVLAALTDALDGYLARTLKQETELGVFLDPLADKLLMVAGFLGIFLTAQSVYKPTIWIQVVILFREVVLALGFVTLHFFSKKVVFHPNWLGKLTTFSQMTLIVSCMMNFSFASYLSWVAAILTICSGIVYTVRELRHFS
jgi:cardiolipin synthase (CMP-forming)